MMELIKIMDRDILGYYYIPENSGQVGIIEIHEDTKEVSIYSLSKYEKKLAYPNYAYKAKGVVKRMFDNGELLERKFLVWG